MRLQKAMTIISAIDPADCYFLILQLFSPANMLSLSIQAFMKKICFFSVLLNSITNNMSTPLHTDKSMTD